MTDPLGVNKPSSGSASATLDASSRIRGIPEPSKQDPTSGGDTVYGSHFPPGAILAGRYRLVARLGQGGMGEVYRADDLKLGEPVALKFLPPSLTLDAEALARFHQEVRISRQVSHRNVCRVFDIAEVDSLCFLIMEYVDGEDLNSLLRRIGRLPEAKALELARQLCSGLAAAHEAGILHRDLKPSNVMVDGRGHAKIMDFGVAHLVDELQDSGQVAGTPAYIAPELLQGKPANIRSDIYGLGLVIYEMFTGERPFEDEALLPMVLRGGRSSPLTPPSEHVGKLDPMIEDALLKTLSEDPKERPDSALEVAFLLPGGDPLAAALAAGETPSPETVAAVPDRGLLDRRWSMAGAGIILLLLPLSQWLGQITLLGLSDPIKEPLVLEDRAQQLLLELGWTSPAVDTLGSYRVESARMEAFAAEDHSLKAWGERADRRPMLLTYWYRQAPASLAPWRVAWSPEPFDPPPVAGEAFVLLDARGRLEQLRLMPDENTARRANRISTTEDPLLDGAISKGPDWSGLFKAAQLDRDAFQPIEPLGSAHELPKHDRRWAWQGSVDRGPPLRIEAASLGASPVFFAITEQGNTAVARDRAEAPIPAGQELLLLTFFLLMSTALVLTYRHLRRGRADRRGATVLGLSVAAISLVGLLAGAHHPPDATGQLFLLLEIVEATAFRSCAVVLVYLALEPIIRRWAPEVLISSTRLLAGRRWDPRVGRDLLAGLVLGVGASASCIALGWATVNLGGEPLAIYGLGQKLSGFGGVLYWMTFSLFLEISGSLLLCLLYALLVAWSKNRLAAGLGLWLVICVIGGFSAVAVLGGMLFVFALVRFGILATIITWTCIDWVLFFPTGAGMGEWWLSKAVTPSLLLAILAIYAARTSIGHTQKARRQRILNTPGTWSV